MSEKDMGIRRYRNWYPTVETYEYLLSSKYSKHILSEMMPNSKNPPPARMIQYNHLLYFMQFYDTDGIFAQSYSNLIRDLDENPGVWDNAHFMTRLLDVFATERFRNAVKQLVDLNFFTTSSDTQMMASSMRKIKQKLHPEWSYSADQLLYLSFTLRMLQDVYARYRYYETRFGSKAFGEGEYGQHLYQFNLALLKMILPVRPDMDYATLLDHCKVCIRGHVVGNYFMRTQPVPKIADALAVIMIMELPEYLSLDKPGIYGAMMAWLKGALPFRLTAQLRDKDSTLGAPDEVLRDKKDGQN